MAVGEVHHRPVGRVDVPDFDLPADEGYPQVQPRDGAARVRNPQWPGTPGRDVAVEHWLTPDDVVLIKREPSSVVEQQHAERRTGPLLDPLGQLDHRDPALPAVLDVRVVEVIAGA